MIARSECSANQSNLPKSYLVPRTIAELSSSWNISFYFLVFTSYQHWDLNLRELIRNGNHKLGEKFDVHYDAVLQLKDRLEIPIPDNKLVEILKRNLRPEIRKELAYVEISL